MDLKIETKALSGSTLAELAQVKKNGSGGGDFGALLKHAETKQSDAALELERYVKMTPGERMAEAIMKQLGISKEEFDAMSPEQKAAVTAQIADIIKQQMEQQAAENKAKHGATAL